MENQIKDILTRNFKGSDIDKARKELCFLFEIKRSDNPKCPDCGNTDYSRLGKLGSYTNAECGTGTSFICDKCYCEFDFDDYN